MGGTQKMNKIERLKAHLEKVNNILVEIEQKGIQKESIYEKLESLAIPELVEVSKVVAELMIAKASDAKSKNPQKRTSKKEVEKAVRSYIFDNVVSQSRIEEYRMIEAKRAKKRDKEENKFFIAFRKAAREYYRSAIIDSVE